MAPGTVLTSMMKRVDVLGYDIVKSVVDGTFKGGVNKQYGLKEGGVQAAMDEYNKGLISDEPRQNGRIEGKSDVGRDRRSQLHRSGSQRQADGYAADRSSFRELKVSLPSNPGTSQEVPGTFITDGDEDMSGSSDVVVEMTGVQKQFGDLVAIEDATLVINKGEIHALVGENGAGKSTLMNILYGLIARSGGEIKLKGTAVDFSNPADAIRAGIGMVHQHFKLSPSFTVAENIVIGAEPLKSYGRVDFKKARQDTLELSRRFGLELDPAAVVAKAARWAAATRRNPEGALSQGRNPYFG